MFEWYESLSYSAFKKQMLEIFEYSILYKGFIGWVHFSESTFGINNVMGAFFIEIL
jgi:hypothetical protein